MTMIPITKAAIQDAMAAAEDAEVGDLRGMYPMACRVLASTVQVLRDEVSNLEASSLSEESLDILRSKNNRLRKALTTAIATLERDGDEWGICAHLRDYLSDNAALTGKPRTED